MNAIDHTMIRESAERQCDEALASVHYQFRSRAALAVAQRNVTSGTPLSEALEYARIAERTRFSDGEAARTAADEMVEAAMRYRDEIEEETA